MLRGAVEAFGVPVAPKKSTLAYANEHRPWQLYQTVFEQTLFKCQELVQSQGGRNKFRFKNKLMSLDGSIIDLSVSMFDWAKFRRTKGAIKLHLLLDHHGYLPSFAVVTEGKTSEIKVARTLRFAPGTILAIDRGYNDYEWFRELTPGGSVLRDAAEGEGRLLLIVCGTNLRASDCANQLWLDKSGSPSRTELQSATPAALDLVRVFAGSDCGDLWQIFGFAGAANSAVPSYTVQLPQRPPTACPAQPPKSEISVVFRPMAKDAKAQREKECDALRQNANMAYHNAIESQISRAAESLAASTVPDSGRTSIANLLYRLADTRGVRRALILTDGEETSYGKKTHAARRW